MRLVTLGVSIMSFYHILPSNGASDTFPNNHASSFSIPIEPPYILNEKWEVALMNVTHSNCINTFAGEAITITEKFKDYSVLKNVAKPTKVILSTPKSDKYFDVLLEVMSEIKLKTANMLEFSLLIDRKTGIHNISWTTHSTKFFFVFNQDLMNLFQLDADTFTDYDGISMKNIVEKTNMEKIDSELSFIISPTSYDRQEFVIKKRNEDASISTLIDRFNKAMLINGRQIATLTVLPSNSVMFQKHEDDNILVILGQEFHEAMRHRQAGLFRTNSQFFLPFDISFGFMRFYNVYLYEIYPTPFNLSLTKTITLSRQQFLMTSTAIKHINDCLSKDDYIQFKLGKDDTVKMMITKDNISITLDNDLRDILGFDRNTYEGRKEFVSSAPISLTRRIQYFYIYSDVCDMVRVGDTKAPLLSILPFNAKECRLLTEKRFTLPMYVPVKKTYISNITVEIYDDAGKLIPFHYDSITSIRLHFRKQE